MANPSYYSGQKLQKSIREYQNRVHIWQNVKKPVYVVSGDNYWKELALDHMIKGIGSKPTRINANLKAILTRMYRRTLGKKTHFYRYTYDGSSMSNADFIALKDYLQNPSKNAVLIIDISDKKAKQTFETYFGFSKKSEHVWWEAAELFKNTLRKAHVALKISEKYIEFESSKLYNEVIANLLLKPEELTMNIERLAAVHAENNYEKITKDLVLVNIEQYVDKSRMRLYESLTLVNRKKAPFEILHELLENGTNPRNILKGIERHFRILLQAKFLLKRGIILPADVGDDREEYAKKLESAYSTALFWKQNKKQRKVYAEMCNKLPESDIQQALFIVMQAYEEIPYEKEGKTKHGLLLNESQLLACMTQLMHRHAEPDAE